MAGRGRDRRDVQRRLRAREHHPAGRRRPGVVTGQLAGRDPRGDQLREAHTGRVTQPCC
jgi:hypothetical protein